MRGHLCQRSNKKTQSNSSTRRFVRKIDNDVDKEPLVLAKPEHLQKHETHPLKNCKLLAGRLNNNYTFFLYDVYVIFWKHKAVDKSKQIRQRLILMVVDSCPWAAFRLSCCCPWEIYLWYGMQIKNVHIFYYSWDALEMIEVITPSRCAQNAALRKRKEWVTQAGPRALSAGWLGNNTWNKGK